MVGLHLDDQTDIGIAIGLISTFRLIGGALATAIYTSIQTSRFADALPGKVQVAAQTTRFSGSIDQLLTASKAGAAAVAKVPGISASTIAAVTKAIKDANSDGYKLTYLVAIAFGCVAIISACLVKDIDNEQRNTDVAAHLENDKSYNRHEETKAI
jgi:pyruvate/2-oxoglutarate dehydrogenase complex dihydrolipoamide acyltransferase (E2) component